MLLALVAVPVNTVFGIVAAMQLTRNEFWGKTFVMSMLDLPFSISPVVTGALLLVNTKGLGSFAAVHARPVQVPCFFWCCCRSASSEAQVFLCAC